MGLILAVNLPPLSATSAVDLLSVFETQMVNNTNKLRFPTPNIENRGDKKFCVTVAKWGLN
jgi:hypothetical protein